MRDEETTYRMNVSEKLEKILTQTTRTNGRVTDLEKNHDKLNTKLTIALTAIVVIIALKLPELLPVLKFAL